MTASQILGRDALDTLETMHVPTPQPIEIEGVTCSFSWRARLRRFFGFGDGGVLHDYSAPRESQADRLEVLLDAARNKPVAGINPKDLLGAKKPDLSLVPPAAMLHTASAMMDGAAKYGPYNWRENPVLARVYVAAAMRHLQQFLDGEDIDPTSGVHHLGHASACCAIVLDARETGNLSDDRPLPGAAGNMVRRWTSDDKFG